jgi:hypothetical protein
MKKIFFIIASLCMLLCSTCSYEDIVPENPFANKQATTAAFTMMETFQPAQYTQNWNYYDTDTSIGGYITFTALQQDADSFVWNIGYEIEPRRGKKILVSFKNMGQQTIKIRLKVYTKPNKLCFPLDDGIDTVDRYLTFVDTSNIIGMWRGYNTNQPDSLYNMGIRILFLSRWFVL